MIEIRKPATVAELHQSGLLVINAGGVFLAGRRREVGIPSIEPIAEPHLIFFDERKHFFVRDRIHVAYNQELLLVIDQLLHILAKETERRIRDDDVGLLKKLHTLFASEVAVFRERRPFVVPVRAELLCNIFQIELAIAVHIPHFIDNEPIRRYLRPSFRRIRLLQYLLLVAGEKRWLKHELRIRDRRRLVARGDEPLQSERVEIEYEVAEEIALERIVAIAVHGLPAKHVRVIVQVRADFFLDIVVLRIELIILRPFRPVQIPV